ncbi:STAS-like domain-containing protein [Macellibacteroides fermentans]|uniref:STAS-like domain-containing protein n=1 Tax=Macellibacteroides fermentans TaxID=879969 RepID=UPI00406D2D1A
MAAKFQLERIDNTIKASGHFGMQEIHPFLATCYDATIKRGYEDIILDFSEIYSAFPGFMLSVCSKVLDLRMKKIDTKLILPEAEGLKKLFVNTNWASIISPQQYEVSSFKGRTHVPTINFKTDREQHLTINKILDAMLCSITTIKRRDLSAIEWSLHEITDNILVHSESNTGGLIQLSSFNSSKKRIEFVVSDTGLGIPTTLKPALNINSDVKALYECVREGVTNGKGAGNGLFGSYETCMKSGGYFNLHSGNASLCYNPKSKINLIVTNEKIPFDGTLIVGCLDYSKPGLLEDALRFKGKKRDGPDFIELLYEDSYCDSLNFILINETESFGTRPAGAPVRKKIFNLIQLNDYKFQINIDFTDAPLLSSSFADEVFGKLYNEIGDKYYASLIRFHNCDPTNKIIIDRSLNQRKQS